MNHLHLDKTLQKRGDPAADTPTGCTGTGETKETQQKLSRARQPQFRMTSYRVQGQSATGNSRLTGASLLLERVLGIVSRLGTAPTQRLGPRTPSPGTLTSLAENVTNPLATARTFHSFEAQYK
jgi:hypothetical protein